MPYAHAEPGVPVSADQSVVYFDGPRRVVATRMDAPRLRTDGRLLTRVAIHFDDGRSTEAEVDDTAIARISTDPEQARAWLASHGVELVRPLMPSIGLWLVRDTTGRDSLDLTQRLTAASASDAFVEATPNLYLRTRAMGETYTPTDPRFPGQWYFQNLKMPEAWALSLGDEGTTIVVVDTGCDLEHPDLIAKLDPGKDVVDDDDDPSYNPDAEGSEHGTECAGLVAAATDNDEGIAGGCPDCRLRCVRMLSEDAIPISANVAAFDFAFEVDAAVVSNSWGFVDPIPAPQALADAIRNVAENGRGGLGAMVLFAAGNDDRELGNDEIEGVEGVICVGAINNFDESTPFTNFGDSVDVVAPTGTITTDVSGPAGGDPTDYTTLFGGTSSACPVAAGLAGLLVSATPEKSSAELSEIMIATTKKAPFAVPDENGHDPLYGYGIINPPEALRLALGLPSEEGGGGSGEGGSSSDGGGGSGTGGASEDEDEDGCGCRIVGEHSSHTDGRDSRGLFALALALTGWFARRRSARSVR